MKKNLFNEIHNFNTILKKDNVSEYAAECAYFTILSFIPFIISLFTIIQYFNLDAETTTYNILFLFPESIQNNVNDVFMEARSKNIGNISISIIFTIWSASKGFFSLSKGIKNIYKIEDNTSNFLNRIESSIYTLLFIFFIILILVLNIFGNTVYMIINSKFKISKKIITLIWNFKAFIFLVGLFILFLLIYSFISKNRFKVKMHILGSLYASISWYVTSYVISLYINFSRDFSIMHSSLTTIIFILMWLYVCTYNILIGAELNYINK